MTISVKKFNTMVKNVFEETINMAIRNARQEEDATWLKQLQEDPQGFLEKFMIQAESKPKTKTKPKSKPKEDDIQRATAVFRPEKCHARIWHKGYGCQCSSKPQAGVTFCKKHMGVLKFGLYTEPKPEGYSWKCVKIPEPVEVAEQVPEPIEEKPIEEKPIEEKPFKKMKVAELREKLKAYGLSHQGKKAELIDRLEEHMAKGVDMPQEIIPLEEKPKKRKKPKKQEEVEAEADAEAQVEVQEHFAQLEEDPEVYDEKEIYIYDGVQYYVDGDDIYDFVNPTRKIGEVDHDTEIITWLSPELEQEHALFVKEKKIVEEWQQEPDEEDVDVSDEE
jgi:hypothetical protein